ncbi:MAG: hypothetical protein V4476_11005 [Pseudomonadota bacterium]
MNKQAPWRRGAAALALALAALGCAGARTEPSPTLAPAADFARLYRNGDCAPSLELFVVDERLVYVRHSSNTCSDSSGGALFDRTPQRPLCTSGGIMPAPRCSDEAYRALFQLLESRRQSGADLLAPAHRIRPLPLPPD